MESELVIAQLWRELNHCVDEIQSAQAPPRDVTGLPDLDYRPTLKGKAMGLAISISLLEGRSVDEVREDSYTNWLVKQ